jgi:CheY-like chemotaxis protein
MVSALHEEGLVEQAKAEGAFSYVSKPVDLEYLLSVLTTGGLLDESA